MGATESCKRDGGGPPNQELKIQRVLKAPETVSIGPCWTVSMGPIVDRDMPDYGMRAEHKPVDMPEEQEGSSLDILLPPTETIPFSITQPSKEFYENSSLPILPPPESFSVAITFFKQSRDGENVAFTERFKSLPLSASGRWISRSVRAL